MIAGSNHRRNTTLPHIYPYPEGPWPEASQDVRAQRAVGFNCLHYNNSPNEGTARRHFMPDKSFLDAHCTDGLRLELMFPSCWNGRAEGGPMHNEHVAYPDNSVGNGNCPEGFDRRLPGLLYETIMATDNFKDQNGSFILSNGDRTGIASFSTLINSTISQRTLIRYSQKLTNVFDRIWVPRRCHHSLGG